MDYGAIAGSLQGLYGGIKTGMDIYNTVQERKLAERKLGLAEKAEKREEAKEAREKETHEYARKGLALQSELYETGRNLQKEWNQLDQQEKSIMNTFGDSKEFEGKMSEVAKGLLDLDQDALQLISETGFLKNPTYVPIKDEKGNVISHNVSGIGQDGREVVYTPENLTLLLESIKAKHDVIDKQLASIIRRKEDIEGRLADILGKTSTYGERRRSAEAEMALAKQKEIYNRLHQEKTEKQKDEENAIRRQALADKRAQAESKLDSETEKFISEQNEQIANYADKPEKVSRAISNKAVRLLEKGYIKEFTTEADQLFSGLYDKYEGWWSSVNKEEYKAAERIISAVTGKVAKKEDVKNILEAIKDGDVSLTPDNIKSIVSGKTITSEISSEGSPSATRAAIPKSRTGAGLGPSNAATPAPETENLVAVRNLQTGEIRKVPLATAQSMKAQYPNLVQVGE